MKNIVFVVISIATLVGCSTKDKYDISRYYDLKEHKEIITSIITYIFTAPPYTKMADRFQAKHRSYYSSQISNFQILKYYVNEDSTHYFYITRPSSMSSEKRGVGGHFKLNKNYQLSLFKEEFVTTVMSDADLKNKAAFLFDEMVKANLNNYINMKHYVQWPNEITSYDTIKYEWVLKDL
jgi:hypothetical protein